MSEDTKSAIHKNITSLFDAAELLASKEYYGPAIHLMMAAREESVKWMLVHCWEHLDQKTKTKIFRHEFKHRTVGIFYFLSGELHAMDIVAGALELAKDKDPEIGKAAELIEKLPKATDDPKHIAETIVASLHYIPDDTEESQRAEIEEALKKSADADEKLRQNSIYVDFDSALKIEGGPQDYKKKDYENIKRNVVLAKYHMDKLAGLNPSKDVLHATFPEWKAELEKSIEKYAARLVEPT